MVKAYQVFDNLATHPDTKVCFGASYMAINIHSDASYLTESKARSRACGHFFMEPLPQDGKPIKLNEALHMFCLILWFVVASAAEAERGALLLIFQDGMIFKLISTAKNTRLL
jgi:hypothetical protein